MPRGYPDWFGQPQFPQYGSVSEAKAEITIATGTETTLVTISGKGRIYGGVVLCASGNVKNADYVKLYVDDVLLISICFYDLTWYGLYPDGDSPLYIIRYDETTPKMIAGIRKDITFSKSFKIAWKSDDANSRVVRYRLHYSLIS
jgi:hypothetical protein